MQDMVPQQPLNASMPSTSRGPVPANYYYPPTPSPSISDVSSQSPPAAAMGPDSFIMPAPGNPRHYRHILPRPPTLPTPTHVMMIANDPAPAQPPEQQAGENRRGRRHVYTQEELRVLQGEAEVSGLYPSNQRMAELAKEIGLRVGQVKTWFKNRRYEKGREKTRQQGGEGARAEPSTGHVPMVPSFDAMFS